MKIILLLICITAISACQSSGRYSQHQDSAPEFQYGELDLQDAQPRYEPYNPANSRPYTVFGKFYTPMLDAKGFTELGQASWYGQKFHGHLTSNGEIYDMFALTAAHKYLPLPSFVKVTNLDNNKVAIVRVNDRGPFHDDRIIDLSYAAAKKLDVIKTGVANVSIEVVHVDPNGLITIGKGPTQAPQIPLDNETAVEALVDAQRDDDHIFVQVAAISDAAKVQQISDDLSSLYDVAVHTPLVDNIYRLRLGPFKTEQNARQLIEELKNIGFDSAFPLFLPAD